MLGGSQRGTLPFLANTAPPTQQTRLSWLLALLAARSAPQRRLVLVVSALVVASWCFIVFDLGLERVLAGICMYATVHRLLTRCARSPLPPLPGYGPGLSNERLALLLRSGDFSSEDYEQLIALDGGTGSWRPAPEAAIRRLPVHTVTEGNDAETDKCMVCLESLRSSETCKTLPCMHRFHEGCIDRWLRLKGECPVCKHGV